MTIGEHGGMPSRRVVEVANELGLDAEALLPHGRFIAKIPIDELAARAGRPDGELILVSAMTPTPQGEGKTTTTIGLGDGLRRLGKKVAICLREPSLGPYFGIKGGGTGAGRSQVVPAEDINLHFVGDMYSVSKANNLLAAMLDNHLQHGNELGIDPRRIVLRRIIDLNDRALREIFVGLGGVSEAPTGAALKPRILPSVVRGPYRPGPALNDVLFYDVLGRHARGLLAPGIYYLMAPGVTGHHKLLVLN